MAVYACCNRDRRDAVRHGSTYNGIETLEVVDAPGMPENERQRTILLTLIRELPAGILDRLPLAGAAAAGLIRIEGGARIQTVPVSSIAAQDESTLIIEVDAPGDFSTYTLRLVGGRSSAEPPEGFDPVLSAVEFSFKAGCPRTFDCREEMVCPDVPDRAPEIDYCARDFESFRRLILDRMALLLPEWTEQNPADAGMALVEVLAYLGDHLSYRQDAIATEAYLRTARRRVSVRRHARLVDYRMHDGCNARAWMHIRVEGDRLRLAPGTQILTGVAGAGTRIAPDSREYQKALDQKPEVFETVHSAVLSRAQNEMRFYAWGDRRCCLPAGATEAWLAGDLSGLMAGDVLIVAEHRDPRTGRPEEADRMHRHAVRLTHVRVTGDPVRSADGGPAPVTLIRWDAADALPAAFCISGSVSPDGKREEYCEDLSIALGNIVLADAGRTLPGAEALGTVAAPALFFAADPQETGNPCARPAQQPVLPRFRPRLGAGPLTHALPYAERTLFGLAFAAGEEDLLARQVESLDDRALPPYLHQAFMNRGIVFAAESLSIQGRLDEWSISDGTQAYRIRLENAHEDAPERLLVSSLPPPAAAVRELSPEEARPAVRLSSRMSGREQAFSWSPVRDLLNSAPEAREYVIETESDGSAWIRFGDGSFGMRPASGEEFFAAYRTGNGPEGNVGSETLVHMVAHDPSIVGVNNPLPAFGGTAPESIDRVREIAPSMFRRQERAVTPEDYAALAMRHPSVQRAAAALQWTGSWYTVFLTVDRFGGREVDEPFKEELLAFLDRYRFMGQDLEIRGPRHVPLEIAVRICVKSGYDRSDVARELISTFSAGRRPDGRRGIFHPDNFSLGQPVYLSHIYRAAGEIEGVSACEVTTFRRLGQPGNEGIDAGRLAIRKFECARLDNDPNFPEHGVFRMELRGG